MKKVLSPVFRVGRWVRHHWKLLTFLLVVVGLIVFWRYKAAQAAKPKLTFEHPAYRDIAKTLQVSGVVDAKEKASLRFAAGGKVVYVGAKQGDLVHKWQTIATIDRRTLQKQLQQDLNTYMTERINRDETLDQRSLHTYPEAQDRTQQRDISQEQLSLENTVLNVEIRDIAIQNTVLSAPFNGILVQSPATVPGVNLLATDAFEVVNPDSLVFRAGVDEADISQISLGEQGTIKLDAYPDQNITTNVSYIDVTSSQTSSGTVFIVELPLSADPELRKFKLGMNGDATLLLDQRHNVLTVPLAATREKDSKMYVDVRDGEKTAEREIKPGLVTDDYVEILDGVRTDDEVLIPGT